MVLKATTSVANGAEESPPAKARRRRKLISSLDERRAHRKEGGPIATVPARSEVDDGLTLEGEKILGSWNESGGRTTGTLSPPGCRRLRRWRGKILCGTGFGPEPPADASSPPGHRPPFSLPRAKFFEDPVSRDQGDGQDEVLFFFRIRSESKSRLAPASKEALIAAPVAISGATPPPPPPPPLPWPLPLLWPAIPSPVVVSPIGIADQRNRQHGHNTDFPRRVAGAKTLASCRRRLLSSC